MHWVSFRLKKLRSRSNKTLGYLQQLHWLLAAGASCASNSAHVLTVNHGLQRAPIQALIGAREPKMGHSQIFGALEDEELPQNRARRFSQPPTQHRIGSDS